MTFVQAAAAMGMILAIIILVALFGYGILGFILNIQKKEIGKTETVYFVLCLLCTALAIFGTFYYFLK